MTAPPRPGRSGETQPVGGLAPQIGRACPEAVRSHLRRRLMAPAAPAGASGDDEMATSSEAPRGRGTGGSGIRRRFASRGAPFLRRFPRPRRPPQLHARGGRSSLGGTSTPGRGEIELRGPPHPQGPPRPGSQSFQAPDPSVMPLGDVCHYIVAPLEFRRERRRLRRQVLDQPPRAQEEEPVAQVQQRGEEVPGAVAARRSQGAKTSATITGL